MDSDQRMLKSDSSYPEQSSFLRDLEIVGYARDREVLACFGEIGDVLRKKAWNDAHDYGMDDLRVHGTIGHPTEEDAS